MSKIGLIGAGAWGKNLVKTLNTMGKLAAVAEVSTDLRAKLSQEYPDVEIHSDYKTILQSELSVVAIATPASTHYQIGKEAILAGKDVFIEKPMTLSAFEAKALVELAEQQEKILMVGHLLLYQPAIQWIKQYITSGSLGKISSLHQERLNLGRARQIENVLWSLGVHDVAVMLYLTESIPKSSQIIGQRVLQEEIEDDVYLHLVFENNVQAHLHTSWLWPERRRQLTIVGSKGMLVYNELEQEVVLHRKGIDPVKLTNQDEGTESVFKGDCAPLTLEMEHFLECVKERKNPVSNGRSGLNVIRVLEEVTCQLKGA